MAAAWYGGLGPAAVAIAVSYLASDFYFVAPRNTFTLFLAPASFAITALVYVVVAATIALMTIALSAGRRRIEESEESLRTLVEGVPVGVFRTDPLGRCLYVNERWSVMTGLSRDQAAGD